MKRLAVIAIILLCCFEGYSQDAAEVVPTPADSVGITPEQMTDSLAAFAFRSLGKRYRTGAMGPNLFDCSGFTSYVFSNFGIKLSRTSREQFGDGHKAVSLPEKLRDQNTERFERMRLAGNIVVKQENIAGANV